MKLGKLHEVDIRKVWPHEQYDFSKWLAAEENIQELGNVLNLSLTDIETERPVDRYRCDILCRDEITGKVVLIENQLEQTNHDHLGKILTYASGLDASVVVWVVAAARDEHASAIEWLNKHTDDSISFFLIEIHAYKIGDSEPAPQFKIIEQPNDFAKTMKRISRDKEMNESQGCRLEFWTQFNDILEQRGKPFNKRKATTDHWYSVAVGSSECQISIDLVNKEHNIIVFRNKLAHVKQLNAKRPVLIGTINGTEHKCDSQFCSMMRETLIRYGHWFDEIYDRLEKRH